MSETLIDQDSGLGKLCSTCRGIFNRWDTIIDRLKRSEFRDVSYYDNVRTWIASADDGCVFCLRMLDNLGRDRAEELRQSLAVGIELDMGTRIYSDICWFIIHSVFSAEARADPWMVVPKFGEAFAYLYPHIPGMLD